MLITFLGAPCSGKTTTAARAFADLKDAGYPAEFIPEQARQYIANLKHKCKTHGFDFPGLEEQDQFRIMKSQYSIEKAFSSDKTVISVADSSVLNGMLYLDEGGRFEMRDYVDMEAKLVDIAFICSPVQSPSISDPNRVHSVEQSLKLNETLKAFVNTWYVNVNVVTLVGDRDFRHNEVMRAIYQRMFR